MSADEASLKHGLLSRTIAYALRHHPEAFDLELDEHGWTAIADLLSAMGRHQPQWHGMGRQDIEKVISSNRKKRFEIDGDRIRALYGHSVGREIQLQAGEPPEHLLHGTTPEALDKIRATGLQSMQRQYVHLSPDHRTARLVALRRTRTPMIITVLSGQAARSGTKFYPRIDEVWLTDGLPHEFLKFPDE